MVQYQGNDMYSVRFGERVFMLSSDEMDIIANETHSFKMLKEENSKLKARNELLESDVEYLQEQLSGDKYRKNH